MARGGIIIMILLASSLAGAGDRRVQFSLGGWFDGEIPSNAVQFQ